MQINNTISASTDIYAVLGYPIAHSMSPLIHNTIAKALDNDMSYHAMCVLPTRLEEAINGGHALGIKGFNITVPHKKKVMSYLCAIDKQAEAIGAVNTLKYTQDGYKGYNTDIIGAYYALKENGIDPAGKTVLILGAGGAGNACAAMAMLYNAKQVYIANRTVDKAETLAKRLSGYYSVPVSAISMADIYNIYDCDIVINATTLGFGDKADLTPIENTAFYKQAGVKMVFDAIYSPWETVLIKQARAVGVKAINGFDMLIYQAVAAQEIWLDTKFQPSFIRQIRNILIEHHLL